MEWDYPLRAFFDERRADMSSAFEDMNMEVCMEENPFEETGLSDGELRETQTANYFSNLYPIDCAVTAVNA